jgi:hypothetical protein
VNALIPKVAPVMEVPGVVQNAIVAERSATLRVRVLKRPEVARGNMAEEEDILASVVVEEVEVEAIKRLGRHAFHVFP